MPRSISYPRCRLLLGVLLYDDDEPRWIDGIEPSRAEWVNNNHREADKAKIVVDYASLPLDPRLIRSVWVGLWLGDVEDPTADISLDDDRFQAFVGYADEPSTRQDDQGDWLSLDCRDYTGLFLDARWPGGFLRIDRPLSEVVAALLDLVPGAADMDVVFADGVESLRLSDQLGRTSYTPDDGDDLWTVIVDLFGRVGLIPVVRLTTLRIETATTFGQHRAGFVYGQNVKTLETRRQLNRASNSAVEVIAYNEATGERKTAVYPSSTAGDQIVTGSGAVVEAATTKTPYYLSGSYSQGDLDLIAQRVYEQRARQAVEGELTTADLWDLDEETRLPLLSNGDAIELRLTDGLSADIRDMTEGEAVAYLTSGPNPMNRAVAEALAHSQAQAQALAVVFYVTQARHRWSTDDGYEVSVAFANFVGGEP